MEIRKKISYQFIGMVAFILLISSLAIYFSFSSSRKEEFFDRLDSKARMIAQMLLEIDEIDTDLLRKIEENNPLSLPNEKVIIFDYQNNIVYSTDTEKLIKIPASLIDEVRLSEVVRTQQGPYEILGHFYTGGYDRIVVFVAANDIFGLIKLKRLRNILLIVFFLSLIIIYFSGRMFAARALRPISDIMRQVNEIGISSLDARVSEGSGKDELARLARTFNKMLERLESAFKIQENFIANASHELRTPLTVITGQLEVILMKARTDAEYRETILSVLEDMKNLNQIANRLLLLAQASSEFAGADFSPVRVDDVLWQSRNEILKRHPDFCVNINLASDIDDEYKLSCKGNELLIKTAFSNLIDNSCKYSGDHTANVFLDNKDGSMILRFSDHGIGIPEEDIKMVFQPFYRASNARGIKGHGIGLSLVEKIISAHHGSISIRSEINRGTEISLLLPVNFPDQAESLVQ